MFPKIVVSQIIHFNRVFHYKPSILGYPYFWKHPYMYIHIVNKWSISSGYLFVWYWSEMGLWTLSKRLNNPRFQNVRPNVQNNHLYLINILQICDTVLRSHVYIYIHTYTHVCIFRSLPRCFIFPAKNTSQMSPKLPARQQPQPRSSSTRTSHRRPQFTRKPQAVYGSLYYQVI